MLIQGLELSIDSVQTSKMKPRIEEEKLYELFNDLLKNDSFLCVNYHMFGFHVDLLDDDNESYYLSEEKKENETQ